jgi:glycosyltransferase involved in cell wall biosynthesis
MLKIAVDFREAAKPTRAGKGEYVYQLLRAWLTRQSDINFVLLIHHGQTIDLPPGKWQHRSFSEVPWLWQLQVLGWLEFSRSVDIYFASVSMILPALVRAVPVVTTLFDFTSWRYPDTHLSRAVRLEKLFTAAALRHSAHLLAISEFTKQEAVQLFNMSSERMTVTPLATDPIFTPGPADEAVRQKYQLPNSFILYLGTLEPRKGLDTLIAAFRLIQDDCPSLSLVLAGGTGWQMQSIANQADDKIYLPGYIDDVDRLGLYRLAELFAFPSLYEGFGLPPLEAMACGIPTIVSDRASLPEVVGNGARIVPAQDPTALATAIRELMVDRQKREQLIERGLDRAQQFNWQMTAQLTETIMRRYG